MELQIMQGNSHNKLYCNIHLRFNIIICFLTECKENWLQDVLGYSWYALSILYNGYNTQPFRVAEVNTMCVCVCECVYGRVFSVCLKHVTILDNAHRLCSRIMHTLHTPHWDMKWDNGKNWTAALILTWHTMHWENQAVWLSWPRIRHLLQHWLVFGIKKEIYFPWQNLLDYFNLNATSLR